MDTPDPIICAIFVLVSFVIAGIVQTLWYKSRWAKRFDIAIDGGRSLQGRRIFGDNKTLRGFVIMIPACGLAFVIVRILFERIDATSKGPWPLSTMGYFWLGCWAGFGFMLGELPNSFLKRRWQIEPGAAPSHAVARASCFMFDQIDSILGGLLAASLYVPIPRMSWFVLLLVGATIHWVFNVVFVLAGLKARAA